MNCRRALRDIPVFNVTEQRNAIVVSDTILTMVDPGHAVWLMETPKGVQVLVGERWWPWLAPIKKGED